MPKITTDYPDTITLTYPNRDPDSDKFRGLSRDTDKKQLRQIKTKIISQKKIVSRYFKLIIYSPYIANVAKPGQFLQIKVQSGYEPFLRRPFSIHRVMDSKIEILYKVIGTGTEILSQRKAGEYLDIIGPLGNGFSLLATRYPLLVAGGMGVAPLVFLAEKLKEIKNQKSKIKNLVLIGTKSKSLILCEKEFKELGCEVKIATDDGSRGFKGKVTELLRGLLLSTRYSLLATLYACGPRPMLKEIAFIARQHNISTQISLEEHMACGIGACLGCVVNTQKGYQRVCKEGPVFPADEIIW